ncbi:Fic/DOC family N-terminal domain-containing protein [Corynebacterium mastitidis]|uniref:Fic family protein n=2 Tax=Corynebacterium mastitidis TaxID=161890 RepID=UPI0030E7DE37
MSIFRENFDISVFVGGYSRCMTAAAFDPSTPYNELPPLPPGVPLETVPVLKAVIGARSRLAALDKACELIPNPQIITTTIPLREAQASSEIENIVTTNDELFRAAWRVEAIQTPATKEALRYNDALFLGQRRLRERGGVSAKLAAEICSVLHGTTVGVRPFPGTYIGDPSSKRHVYTLPEGKEVIERHLSAWERFLYSEHGLDPLVLMAVAHYQFEAIHPFPDGNGRTGRILNILFLMQEKVLRLPVLYLSGYIVRNKSEYYRRLRRVTTHGEWEPWLLYMVSAVESAAREATEMIDHLRLIQEELAGRMREEGRVAAPEKLAEILMRNPYVRIADVVDEGLAKRQTASAWLASLVELGLLREVRAGREKIFVNRAALAALTA